MGFYDRLEKVSGAIDDQVNTWVWYYEIGGIVGLILSFVPAVRSKNLLSLLGSVHGNNWVIEFYSDPRWNQTDHDQKKCAIEIAGEKVKRAMNRDLYNAIKYWWMPKKNLWV